MMSVLRLISSLHTPESVRWPASGLAIDHHHVEKCSERDGLPRCQVSAMLRRIRSQNLAEHLYRFQICTPGDVSTILQVEFRGKPDKLPRSSSEIQRWATFVIGLNRRTRYVRSCWPLLVAASVFSTPPKARMSSQTGNWIIAVGTRSHRCPCCLRLWANIGRPSSRPGRLPVSLGSMIAASAFILKRAISLPLEHWGRRENQSRHDASVAVATFVTETCLIHLKFTESTFARIVWDGTTISVPAYAPAPAELPLESDQGSWCLVGPNPLNY
jgi:hypothetical protein